MSIGLSCRVELPQVQVEKTIVGTLSCYSHQCTRCKFTSFANRACLQMVLLSSISMPTLLSSRLWLQVSFHSTIKIQLFPPRTFLKHSISFWFFWFPRRTCETSTCSVCLRRQTSCWQTFVVSFEHGACQRVPQGGVSAQLCGLTHSFGQLVGRSTRAAGYGHHLTCYLINMIN